MIPFNNRFHGYSSLSYVYKNGKTIRSRMITMRFIENKRNKNSRLAVVVSKKIFKSAVKRNRIRRRIYECLRLDIDKFKAIYDTVFIVNSEDVLFIPHKDLKKEINNLLDQAEILKGDS